MTTATEDTEYDPFAAFSDVVAGDTRDPYPDFVTKRRDTPIWKGELMTLDFLPEGFDVEPGWNAFRYDDCSRILRDAKTFTSTGYDDTIGLVMGHMILGMDDPEHRTHRNLVANAFREKSLARWEPEFIAPVVDELIDRFVGDGRADLVRQLTFEFPVRVISRLLGLPEEDFLQFQRWSIELIGLVADIDRGLAASESLRAYFADVVAERRAAATRGHHQRPGHRRGRRRAPERRGHLLLLAAAPARPGPRPPTARRATCSSCS